MTREINKDVAARGIPRAACREQSNCSLVFHYTSGRHTRFCKTSHSLAAPLIQNSLELQGWFAASPVGLLAAQRKQGLWTNSFQRGRKPRLRGCAANTPSEVLNWSYLCMRQRCWNMHHRRRLSPRYLYQTWPIQRLRTGMFQQQAMDMKEDGLTLNTRCLSSITRVQLHLFIL